MSVGCQSSQPLSREHCVLLTLRAWLNTVVPLTIGELNAKVQTLGRPAKNLIARSGGLQEFLKLCPELTVSNEKVEISLNSSTIAHTENLDPREISARLNRLSTNDINTLNRDLTKLHIGSRSSPLVSALQKREQLVELKRQCEIKRSEIASLKERVRADSPQDSRDTAEHLDELENRRIEALKRLSEKEVFLEEKVRLEKLLIKLDKEIESREDRLGRLNLKILYNQEKLAMFEQDLFFESRQHESLTHELLEQHSSDSKKLAKVFEVLVREKLGHSEAVLEAHIRALEGSGGGENRASRSCRRLLSDVRQRREEYLQRIKDNRIDLQMISQLDVITIDSIQSPLFGEKIAEAPDVEETSPATESVATPSGSDRTTVGKDGPNVVCAICLTDLTSAPSERLKCAHNFHSSCLADMYSSGTSRCPLCRQFEPSSKDFPTL